MSEGYGKGQQHAAARRLIAQGGGGGGGKGERGPLIVWKMSSKTFRRKIILKKKRLVDAEQRHCGEPLKAVRTVRVMCTSKNASDKESQMRTSPRQTPRTGPGDSIKGTQRQLRAGILSCTCPEARCAVWEDGTLQFFPAETG